VKNDKFGYLNPILWKLGVTHDPVYCLVPKPMVDFLFALIQSFFAVCYIGLRFRSYEAKRVYSSAVFHRGGHLCSQIL